jgi:nucleotide-binding universal stress UspA family protein
MSTDDSTAPKASEEEKEKPKTTTSAQPVDDDSPKKTNEKKVVVVAPTNNEVMESDTHYASVKEGKKEEQKQQQRSISSKVKEAGQSIKGIFRSASKNQNSLERPRSPPSAVGIQYNRILIPHDGSEMSDNALNHTIFLSKLSGAEILILHVIEDIHNVDSSAFLATSKEGGQERDIDGAKEQDFEIKVEGGVKQMIDEKMKFCEEAGVKSQVSYRVQTGKAVEEIIKLSEEMDVDLIVMASRRVHSLTRSLLGSTTRKVIDSVEKPVLIVHK